LRQSAPAGLSAYMLLGSENEKAAAGLPHSTFIPEETVHPATTRV